MVALTVTPALAFILLRNAPIERQRSPITKRLQDAYAGLIARVLRMTRPAFLTVGAVSLAGLAIWPQLGQSLLPDFKERDFLMHWVTAPGTSIQEETRITIAACNELREIPGVRNCGSHIGQAFVADEPYGVEFGENWISIDPAVDYDKTHAAVLEVVERLPGPAPRRADLPQGADPRGADRDRAMRSWSGSTATTSRSSRTSPRTSRTSSEVSTASSTSTPNSSSASRRSRSRSTWQRPQQYGVKPGDVRRIASTFMAGEEVGDIFHTGKAYDVRGLERARESSQPDRCREPADRHRRPAARSPSRRSPTCRSQPTAGHVSHEQTARRIDVDANVRDRDLGAVIEDVKAALASTEFPQGYHPELLGEFQERQKAQDRLLLFAIAAAIGVFLLLQASFGNTRLAILSFLTLPFALVGGILAAWLGTGVISLGRAGRVLHGPRDRGPERDHDDQPLPAPGAHEGETFGPELVIRGARERLAPILMTALATGLALVPLAIAGDLPGHEIEHPMAIVILGGLVTSTLLNLFVVPALYLRFGRTKAVQAIGAS